MQYHGKEPCAGCGVPGTKKARLNRDSVCYDCREEINLGRAFKKDFSDKFYTNAELGWNVVDNMGLESKLGGTIQEGFNMLLEALHAEGVEWSDSAKLAKKTSWSSSKFFTIKKQYIEPLQIIVNALIDIQDELKEKYRQADNHAEKEIRKAKNKVFNEGVAKGRQLLIGLNNGEITLAEFDKVIKKF